VDPTARGDHSGKGYFRTTPGLRGRVRSFPARPLRWPGGQPQIRYRNVFRVDRSTGRPLRMRPQLQSERAGGPQREKSAVWRQMKAVAITKGQVAGRRSPYPATPCSVALSKHGGRAVGEIR